MQTFVSLKRLDSLSKFGPLIKDETLQKELKEARSKILELDTCFAKVRAENDLLKSQVFRYDNVKGDPQQPLFLTGLTIGMWDALWEFLKPSPENVLAQKRLTLNGRED